MKEMSDKRKQLLRHIFYEAWSLKKRSVLVYTMGFSTALRLAWKTMRSIIRYYHSKVRGTTYGNRQKLLRRLSLYDPKDVIVSFEREIDNAADPNAIQVVASVKDKSSAVIGYLGRNLAAHLAPLLDVRNQAIVIFDGITGIGRKYLGCNFKFIIGEAATIL